MKYERTVFIQGIKSEKCLLGSVVVVMAMPLKSQDPEALPSFW
jgi:hypothetical protein